MEIIVDGTDFGANSVVTIGSYDGVHCGHRSILQTLIGKAKELHAESVVLTMYPHPRKALNLDVSKLKLLNTLKEKSYLLEKTGISALYVAEFTKEFSLLTGEQFIKEYLVGKLRARAIVVGYDHRFGHNREFGYDFLATMGIKYGFEVIEIPKYEMDKADISSTTIRNLISNGEIVKANKFLCSPYMFIAQIDNDGVLVIDNDMKLIPPAGIYLADLEFNDNQITAKVVIDDNAQVRIVGHMNRFNGEIIVKIINKA